MAHSTPNETGEKERERKTVPECTITIATESDACKVQPLQMTLTGTVKLMAWTAVSPVVSGRKRPVAVLLRGLTVVGAGKDVDGGIVCLHNEHCRSCGVSRRIGSSEPELR